MEKLKIRNTSLREMESGRRGACGIHSCYQMCGYWVPAVLARPGVTGAPTHRVPARRPAVAPQLCPRQPSAAEKPDKPPERNKQGLQPRTSAAAEQPTSPALPCPVTRSLLHFSWVCGPENLFMCAHITFVRGDREERGRHSNPIMGNALCMSYCLRN